MTHEIIIYMRRMLIIIGLAALGLFLLFIYNVSPSRAGVMGLLFVFLLLFTVLVCFITIGIEIVSALLYRGLRSTGFRKGHLSKKMTLKMAYYYSSVISVCLIIIVSLGSIKKVTIYDLGLVLMLLVVGFIYVNRRSDK